AIYEGTIPFEQMYASLDARMHTIPRYRQRAVTPPFYAGHPTWEDDPRFSLDRHLKLVTLDAPGTEQQLRELASDLFAKMLPRDRPLWDIVMIQGLEGDRTAMLSRVHHCLVDGVSGIELLLAVLDLVPDPEPTPPPAEPWHPKATPGPVESLTEAMFDQMDANMRALAEWQANLLDPRAQFRMMTDFQRAVEIAVPSMMRRAPQTPWNKPVSGTRRVAWTSMQFQEVRGIRSALGGTVNDVMLTILGGALGRYLRDQGVQTEGTSLRLMIPVNVRSESEQGALGNRVSMMLPEIPVGIANPAERLLAVREQMENLKSDKQADAFEQFARISQNLPAAFHALAGMGGIPAGNVNLICTNVPGPLIPLYAVGHRMLAHYPMVPLAGDLGIGAGITSYDKALYLGVMADPQACPDIDTIQRYADEEFLLLRTLANVQPSDLPDIGARGNGNGHNGKAASPALAPSPEAAATSA
ncbi:MAG TPA: wax ester/triacylglycerol synthase family O-acyltransferase, partial [Dehalococcoidia bacterium]|nr:wax ester/triacylglycerol synthase family O-acyltransferase [Dehalococcoidia bacterium]